MKSSSRLSLCVSLYQFLDQLVDFSETQWRDHVTEDDLDAIILIL
jgi:hypothetical protein